MNAAEVVGLRPVTAVVDVVPPTVQVFITGSLVDEAIALALRPRLLVGF